MKKEEYIERYGEEAWARKLERRRMTNAEFKERYGEEAYQKRLEQVRDWHKRNKGRVRETRKKRGESTPEATLARTREQCCKDGKYYEAKRIYDWTGLQREKKRIRSKHQVQYRPYKDIIAPDSQLHHQWKPNSAEYTGVALVEANPHQYGIIDVIQILDGEITLLTEEDVRNGRKTDEKKN